MITKKKILQYTLGPVGSGLLAVFSLPLTTWFYDVEDVGRISMLQVFVSLSVLVFSLGLDQSYVREYHNTHDKYSLLKTLLLPGLIVCITVLLAVFIYRPTLISFWLFDIPNIYLSLITIICFVVALISKFLSLILRMQERALAFSLSQLLPRILLLLLITVTVISGLKRDSINLLTIHTISIVTGCIVFGFNTRRSWLPALTSKFSFARLKPHLAFGLPLLIGSIASWGLNTSDRLFLKSMSSYAELGVYSVAMSLAGVATIFAGIFNVIWAPLVYRWISDNTIDYKKIDLISEYVLATIYFVTSTIGLFSWLVPLFLPEKYVPVQLLLTVCLLGQLFNTLAETTAIGITITKKTKLLMYASIICMLIGISSNYFLIPILGASGAAITLAVTFWIYYVLRTEFSKSVWRDIPSKKPYLVTLFLLIVCIINLLISMHSLIRVSLWLIMILIGFLLFKNALKDALNLLKGLKINSSKFG